jgi:chemotaxis protein methyltransferase CheR
LIAFRNENLKANLPRFVQPLDIIFCRNVIIYFDKTTQADLMKRCYTCLRPGGHLFLGHSESLNGICSLYQFVRASIYRKEGK